MNGTRVAHLLVLFASTQMAVAQRHVLLLEADEALPRKIDKEQVLRDRGQVPNEVSSTLARLYANGHLEAHTDTCISSVDTTYCKLHIGPSYRWARLSSGTMEPEMASEARIREKLYRDRPVTPAQVGRLMEDILDLCETTGHPFAQVGLDSVVLDSSGLHASIRLDKGRFVKIDSILIKGDAVTNERFLHNQIGIRPGDPYNEELIVRTRQKLRNIPFVTVSRSPYVQFTPEQTKLFLFLDAKKASSINGILGILPDAVTGEVTITGDLDLKLRNALKRGEAIDLSWRRLQDRTQELKLRYNHPFLFNTPFGADLSFNIFRRDTTFLEVRFRAALEFLLPQGDKAMLFVRTLSSDRLGTVLSPVPGLADVNITAYGMGLFRERLDQRLNPRRGHALDIQASTGNKRSTTATFGDANIEPVRSVQYELEGKGVAHVAMARRSSLRFVGQGGWMINDMLFLNELYRIGGIKSMRGVNEASIFCSAYAIGTFEYRFLYEENANFHVFVDQGWWENDASASYISDDPLGFGVGTSFETKAGIFSITYALAQQFSNPVVFRDGKVHFGFLSLF